MKLHLLTFLVFTISSVAFAADENVAPSITAAPAAPTTTEEKTALANFKTQIEEAGKWIEEKQKTAAADPTAGIAMVSEIIARLKAIKTDGLPADLKAAWGEMGGVLTEMGEVFKGFQVPKTDKPEDAMKALGEIMPKLMAIQGKMEPISKKLQEVGTKYGLDMKKVAPGN